MLYNYIVKGYNKAELIGTIEDKIFSNIAEYDSNIADICSELFDTNDYTQLKQLNNFLTDLLNEINEKEYIDSLIHYIYYNDNAYTIERKGYHWILHISATNNKQYNTLVDLLEELATF